MSMIIRDTVKSSSILSIGYEEQTETLHVEFTSFALYEFAGVKKDVYEGLKNATSKGIYFQNAIRGKYPTVCIRPRPKMEKPEDKNAKNKVEAKEKVKARAKRNQAI